MSGRMYFRVTTVWIHRCMRTIQGARAFLFVTLFMYLYFRKIMILDDIDEPDRDMLVGQNQYEEAPDTGQNNSIERVCR